MDTTENCMQKIYERTLGMTNKIVGLGYTFKARDPQKPSTWVGDPLVFEKPLNTLIFNPQVLKLTNIGQYRAYHELELGIFIGKKGFRIPKAQALDHIGGYVLLLDISSNIMGELRKQGKGFILGKGGDNYTPCSQLIPKESIKNINNVDLELKVDGQIAQYANTSELIFEVEQFVEFVSQYMTLNEGDLIMTGTMDGGNTLLNGQHLEVTLKENGVTLAELNMKMDIEVIE